MNKKRGSAFIVALLTSVVMVLVVMAFTERLTSHLRVQTIQMEQRKARQMALSGIARAMSDLQDVTPELITDQDLWWALGNGGDEKFVVGKGSFRLQVIDAGSFINLNTITEEHLRVLNFTDEQIAAILDWRNGELQPRELGAKDEYYNSLLTPYNAKLRPFDTVNEIFLVKGITPQDLYQVKENTSGVQLVAGGTDQIPILADLLTVDSLAPNTRADGTAKVNLNTANEDQMESAGLEENAAEAIINYRNSNGPFQTMGDVFQVPGINQQQYSILIANFSITNDTTVPGMININTASEPVLNSLPNIEPDVVQAILGRQGTFQDLTEITSLPGMTSEALRNYGYLFTVGSNAFIVRVQGTYGAAKYALEAVVEIEEGQPKVRKIQQLPFPDVIARWGWVEETTSETILIDQ